MDRARKDHTEQANMDPERQKSHALSHLRFPSYKSSGVSTDSGVIA